MGFGEGELENEMGERRKRRGKMAAKKEEEAALFLIQLITPKLDVNLFSSRG